MSSGAAALHRREFFGEIQHVAAVAVGHRAQAGARFRRERQRVPEIGFGALEQRLEIVVVETAQHQHLGARQQRAVQLE